MENNSKSPVGLSKQAILRLPNYLQHLKKMKRQGVMMAAASVIAADLRLNEVQVRKDLAAVSSLPGKPKMGFQIDPLIHDIEEFLGYHNVNEAILVGCGSLGTALLNFTGFRALGLQIVAAFDSAEEKCNVAIGDKPVLPMDKMQSLCRRLNVHIGIITTPADAAQKIADEMIECGILAIWNFAPVRIVVPKGILVHNENMAASLALLSKHLKERLD
ncbi:MAG: redox-sensing transcriptional repressor Rex [Bacillota bacterium]